MPVSPNHPELWLQFSGSLGFSKEDVEAAAIWPETQSLVDRFRAASRDNGTAARVAALYAYESQIPAVSESKIDGFRNFYGYEYFRVHIEADKGHSTVERNLLGSLLNISNRATSPACR